MSITVVRSTLIHAYGASRSTIELRHNGGNWSVARALYYTSKGEELRLDSGVMKFGGKKDEAIAHYEEIERELAVKIAKKAMGI